MNADAITNDIMTEIQRFVPLDSVTAQKQVKYAISRAVGSIISGLTVSTPTNLTVDPTTDEGVPLKWKREFIEVACQHPPLSYYYLCSIWRQAQHETIQSEGIHRAGWEHALEPPAKHAFVGGYEVDPSRPNICQVCEQEHKGARGEGDDDG